MQYTLNWRFLIVLLVVCGVLGAGVFGLHRFQVQRQTGVFLAQADAAKEKKDIEREIRYLQRYLAAEPTDIENRDRLARLMAENAQGPKQRLEAHLVLEDVLRRDPNRDDLRRFTAKFCLEAGVGLISQARNHIEELKKRKKDDPELMSMYGQIMALEQRWDAAIAAFEKARKDKPDLLDAYIGHASILRDRKGDPKVKEGSRELYQADQIVGQMTDNNSTDYKAQLMAAGWWRVRKDFAQSAACVDKARQLAPKDQEVMIIAAALEMEAARKSLASGETGKVAANQSRLQAREILNAGIKEHPQTGTFYAMLAELDAETGKPEKGVEILKKGLETAKDQAPLLAALTDYQIRINDHEGATQTLNKWRDNGLRPEREKYERARILILKEQWKEAADLLNDLRFEFTRNPEIELTVYYLLGRCYEQLGDHQRRLDALRKAVPQDLLDSKYVPAMIGLAEALQANGKLTEAQEAYEKVGAVYSPAWLQAARLRLTNMMTKAPQFRRLDLIDDALLNAHQAAESVEGQLIRAELAMMRGKSAEARTIIEKITTANPKLLGGWVALTLLELREGNQNKAKEAMATAVKNTADSVELRLAQARFLSTLQAKEETPARLKQLAEDQIDRFNSYDKRRLWTGLASIATSTGNGPYALELWNRIVGLDPNFISAHLARFELAMDVEDEKLIQQALEDIRKINGEVGTYTRAAKALYQVWRATKGKGTEGLNEANTLLTSLEQEGTSWNRVNLYKALTLDLLKNYDEALKYYQRAFEDGQGGMQVIRRLVTLLIERGRTEDANQVMTRMPNLMSSDSDTQRMAAQLSLMSSDPKRAMEIARKAVPADSKNANDQLWLARMNWSSGRRSEAEPHFRQAVELDPSSTEAWLALISYLTTTNRREQAIAEVTRALPKISPEEKPLFEAQAYANAGVMPKARDAFKVARTAKPNDLRILRMEAEYLTQVGLLTEARAAWERIIQKPDIPAEDRESAKNMLAVSLAADPDYQVSRKAIEMLGFSDAAKVREAASSTDFSKRRVAAIVLGLQKDRASKLEGIRILEESRETLSQNDLYLLSRFHLQVGNTNQARGTLAKLTDRPDASPFYLANYLDVLLNAGDYSSADPVLVRLQTVDPGSLQTDALAARLAAGRKDLNTARSLLMAQAAKPNAPLLAIAGLCENIKLTSEAESLLKKFVTENQAKRPEVVLALAEFYHRQGRLSDCLAICDAAWETCNPNTVAQVALEALYTAPNLTAADINRVAIKLEAAIAKQTEPNPALLGHMAVIHNLRQDWTKAIDIYQKLMSINAKDPVAANNLAFLLSAALKRHDEALIVLQQIRSQVGPLPELLDTEAYVRIKKGDLNGARKLLEDVIALSPSAVAHYHLALVETLAKRDLEARKAWLDAMRKNLKISEVHPLERAEYQQMASNYN